MEICISKLYGPSKKRSICVARKYPRGCGMKAAETITEQLNAVNRGCGTKAAETIIEQLNAVNSGCGMKAAEIITEQLNAVNHLASPSKASYSDKTEGNIEDAALPQSKASNGLNVSAQRSSVENDTIKETKHEEEAYARLDLHRPRENIEIELCTSKLYGSPKRRKLSAIRHFPSHCGPLAFRENQPSGTPRCEASGLMICKEPAVDQSPLVKDNSLTKVCSKASALNGRIESKVPTNVTEGKDSGDNNGKKNTLSDTVSMIETEEKVIQTQDESLSNANSYKKSLNAQMALISEGEQTNKFVMKDSSSSSKKVKRNRTMDKSGKAGESQFQLSHGRERSPTDSRTPTEAGVAEKDSRPLFGKSLTGRPVTGVKIPKRECIKEHKEDKSESTSASMCEVGNPNSDRDRIIVLALKAQPTRLSRQGKGSVKAVQQSSSTLVKRKKNT